MMSAAGRSKMFVEADPNGGVLAARFDSRLRLDKTMATFLDALDKWVGLDHVLVALTADPKPKDEPVAFFLIGDTHILANKKDPAKLDARSAGLTAAWLTLANASEDAQIQFGSPDLEIARVRVSKGYRAATLDSLGYPPHPAKDIRARQMRREENHRFLIRLGVAAACAALACFELSTPPV